MAAVTPHNRIFTWHLVHSHDPSSSSLQVALTQPLWAACSTSPTLIVWAPPRWIRSSWWLTASSWWLRWRRSSRRESPSMAWSPPRSEVDRQQMTEWLSVFVFLYIHYKKWTSSRVVKLSYWFRPTGYFLPTPLYREDTPLFSRLLYFLLYFCFSLALLLLSKILPLWLFLSPSSL